MNQPIPRRLAALLLVAALAACTADATPSPTAEPTESATPTSEPTATATASAEPEETEAPEASVSPDSGSEGFSIAPHPEADSLFLTRDDCENLEDGYRLQYPDGWSTNDEAGGLPPCSWFAPESFAVDDPADIPDDVAITIELVAGDTATRENAMSEDEVIVGGTQTAIRTEFEDEGTTMLEYIVQLGPTLAEGPVLLARTDSEMGGDYELNKAVLDRIMATIEFIGTVQ